MFPMYDLSKGTKNCFTKNDHVAFLGIAILYSPFSFAMISCCCISCFVITTQKTIESTNIFCFEGALQLAVVVLTIL